MARRRNTKAAVKKQNTSAAIQKMEKDFLAIPAALAAQLNKEISQLKQKQQAHKKTINNHHVEAKKSELRILSVAKAKPSAAQKKQLKAAKLNQAKIRKAVAQVEKELQAMIKTIAALQGQQLKLNAQRKNFAQFQKDWKSQAKQTIQATAKVKSNTKPKAIKEPAQSSTSDLDNNIHLERHDETTEITS